MGVIKLVLYDRSYDESCGVLPGLFELCLVLVLFFPLSKSHLFFVKITAF